MLTAIGDDPILWVNVKTLEPEGEWSNEQMQLWNQALVEAAARYPEHQDLRLGRRRPGRLVR